MHAIRAATGLVILSLAIAACTTGGQTPVEGPMESPVESSVESPVETSAAAPFAAYDRSEPGVGDAALLTAILVLDRGCLYADSEGRRWLPVFPAAGTEWDAAARTLTMDGRTAVLGQTVELGGGTARADVITSAPEGCDRSRVWLVVSVGS